MGSSLHDSLPKDVVVGNSNSTHPASTLRTSLDSQKLDTSSPATFTSRREDEREEKTRERNSEQRMRMGEIVGEGEERDEGHSEGELGRRDLDRGI